MGNPKGVTTSSARASLDGENGIMAAVPPEVISLGSGMLPPAESMPGQRSTVEVDAGGIGIVRITYESKQLRHRRSSFWAWLPKRADRV